MDFDLMGSQRLHPVKDTTYNLLAKLVAWIRNCLYGSLVITNDVNTLLDLRVLPHVLLSLDLHRITDGD